MLLLVSLSYSQSVGKRQSWEEGSFSHLFPLPWAQDWPLLSWPSSRTAERRGWLRSASLNRKKDAWESKEATERYLESTCSNGNREYVLAELI